MSIRFIGGSTMTEQRAEKAGYVLQQFGALLQSKILAGLKLEKRALLARSSNELFAQTDLSTRHPEAFLEIVVCKSDHRHDCDCTRYCFLNDDRVVRRFSNGKERAFQDLQEGLLDLIHELPINKKPTN